jgi:(p)ppGpp synthase/HD superfamily hydrolase
MTIESETAKLTSRFEEALQYAARLHAKQKRKGTDVPYVSHLLAVTAIVRRIEGRGLAAPPEEIPRVFACLLLQRLRPD